MMMVMDLLTGRRHRSHSMMMMDFLRRRRMGRVDIHMNHWHLCFRSSHIVALVLHWWRNTALLLNSGILIDSCCCLRRPWRRFLNSGILLDSSYRQRRFLNSGILRLLLNLGCWLLRSAPTLMFKELCESLGNDHENAPRSRGSEMDQVMSILRLCHSLVRRREHVVELLLRTVETVLHDPGRDGVLLFHLGRDRFERSPPGIHRL